MDQEQVGKLALVFVIATAGISWLLALEDRPELRPLLIVVAVVVVAGVAIIMRSRLINATKVLIARVRESPTQAGLAVRRVLDADGARAAVGFVAIAILAVGVVGAVESLNSRIVAGVFGWGAVAVVGSVGNWYLIAWRRTGKPVARVEAFSSEKVVHFTAEDQEDAERFDFSTFRKAELIVKPGETTGHWRLGIEFSDNLRFSGWRYGIGHALWHLTKNGDDARLLVSYYNAQGQHEGNSPAMVPYGHGTILVTIEVHDGDNALSVRVPGNPGYTRVIHADHHRYGRLFAWADGRPYELTVRVKVE